jgi:hypothetical protein
MQFSADLAKPLVPMESLVNFPVLLAQHLNLLHFLVVFLRGGEKREQPRFEDVIRLRGFGEKFLPSRTKFLRHGADFYAEPALKSIGFTGFLHRCNGEFTAADLNAAFRPQTYSPVRAL